MGPEPRALDEKGEITPTRLSGTLTPREISLAIRLIYPFNEKTDYAAHYRALAEETAVIPNERFARVQFGFHGSIYPEALSSEIYALWAAHLQRDEREVSRLLEQVQAKLSLLETTVQHSQGRNTDLAKSQATTIGYANYHIGLIFEALNQYDETARDPVPYFEKSAKWLDRDCTPRIYSLASLALIDHTTNKSLLFTTGNMHKFILPAEASAALANIPFHENPWLHCIAAARFERIADRRLGEINGSKYKRLIDRSCSQNQK